MGLQEMAAHDDPPPKRRGDNDGQPTEPADDESAYSEPGPQPSGAPRSVLARISEDFLQGDVQAGLERIRKRLLDLSLRSRLLNFKHTKKGALRTVDELPDQLFGQLVEGKNLYYKPVPRPRGQQFPVVPSQLLLEEEAEPDPTRASRPKPPSALDEAERLGIATSFDLPKPPPAGQEQASRHMDREIQVLHYPEELEALLRSISSAARLATEETGANMLYLAFGFLEWTESEDSDKKLFAPLVMLPVSIQKEDPAGKGSAFRYGVSYSGEDIQINISLQEKLRRDYDFDLPEFEEEETPEAYFKKLQPLIDEHPGWAIRRQVTLTLLSFTKLLMYRDLDSSRWPRDRGPAKHPRIAEFFEGVERGTMEFAVDYGIDQPDIRAKLPDIVDEADSSQHSALIDALAGKNLVIEGPPGTGKSQTIANLIAAAMVDGKTVLFVSEKLAALEVVRHRLDGAGLGSFCLELHSHKTQKRRLLEDVAYRMGQQRSFVDPRSLDQKLQQIEDDKRVLTAYATLVNTEVGQIGLTLHEVLWKANRTRRTLGAAAGQLEDLELEKPEHLTTQRLEQLRQCLEKYRAHLERVLGGNENLLDHPWAGVRNTELTFLDEKAILSRISAFRDAVGDSIDAIVAANKEVGANWLPGTLDELRLVSKGISKLPSTSGDSIPDLIPKLRARPVRERLRQFIHLAQRYRTIRTEILDELGCLLDAPAGAATMATDLVNLATELVPSATTIADVKAIRGSCEAAREAIEVALPSLKAVRGLLSSIPDANARGAWLASQALALGLACPVERLRFRHDGLTEATSDSVLTSASRDAAALRTYRDALAKYLNLRLSPRLEDLRAHVAVTAAARWWTILTSSSFRDARRAYIAMSTAHRTPRLQNYQAGYSALLQFAEENERFAQRAAYRAACGRHFAGIDSPFAALLELAAWRRILVERLDHRGADAEALHSELWSASPETVSALQATAKARNDAVKYLTRALDAAARALAHLTSADWVRERPWDDVIVHLRQATAKLETVVKQLGTWGFPDRTRLSEVPRLLALQAELLGTEEKVVNDREAQEALGDAFRRVDTNVSDVAASLDYFQTISESPTPSELRVWLLHRDADRRLVSSHTIGRSIAQAVDLVQHTWDAFSELTRVDWSEWNREPNECGRTVLTSLFSRARRALDGRVRLQEWLDYLSSRADVVSSGIEMFCAPAESGSVRPEQLSTAFEFVYAHSFVRIAFRQQPQLARFSGLSHTQVRARFAALDREAIELFRKRAALLISLRQVPAGNGRGPANSITERHLLDRETNKQKRHIPLRQLVRRAGQALQALKPCFMMGPLSVAQYLEPGAMKFDLVIMDEASQLRPEDSLGALARGAQFVIVGDRMQLPPTSFFDRIGDDVPDDVEEDPAGALADAESILDVAAGVYKPARMLKWHYRSRHESLIAFSNREFYDGKLTVFPSPSPKDDSLGVKFIHVRDGCYKNRQNEIEARRVVQTVLRHFRTRANESLGVVTLNAPQRDLIEEMLEHRLRDDPVAQKYVRDRTDGLEPFFVKNLENVQGDERDVIFTSITFGRSPEGQVYQRFGPIGGVVGHRRLNVLFTRARKRMVVFSSMVAEDVVVTPKSAWGTRALKGYLHYARTGILEQATVSGRDPDSDFEVEVAQALKARGFAVVAQVGVAGYFIDLAVKDPARPDAYILGIECDGRTYHSSLSARDRDRLRQSILENLGWKIHRIWSTDWFRQSAPEVDRIVARIAEISREQAAREAAAIEELRFDDEELVEGEAPSQEDWRPEVASQPLSVEEAKLQLEALRAEIELTHPGVAPGMDPLLTDEMINALLRHKPARHDDWLRTIPLELRLKAHGQQVSFYLPRVLAITSQLAR